MITETVKREIKLNPHVLFPYGKIEKAELTSELAKYNFKFPDELVEFWVEFGGGDFFEVETVLYPLPTTDSRKDSLIALNEYYHTRGLNPNFCVFETNNALITVFNINTHEIMILDDDNFVQRKKFSTINDWFIYFWQVNQ